MQVLLRVSMLHFLLHCKHNGDESP